MGAITAPQLLTANHNTSEFNCGTESLDEWLSKRAWKNQQSGASRTFVICSNNKVIGYYALATGSIERAIANNNFARSMPVVILGRLAVDGNHQGQRLGAALLKDAMLRTLSIASNVGIRGLLVHALSEEAKQFYLNYGFKPSPMDSMTLLLSINHLSKYL